MIHGSKREVGCHQLDDRPHARVISDDADPDDRCYGGIGVFFAHPPLPELLRGPAGGHLKRRPPKHADVLSISTTRSSAVASFAQGAALSGPRDSASAPSGASSPRRPGIGGLLGKFSSEPFGLGDDLG